MNFIKRNFYEILLLVTYSILFFLINIRDLDSWFYSVIGDEYDFFSYAKYSNYSFANIFSQEGVFGYHPVLSSYYQSLVMQLFGSNNFGWRVSSILIVIASFPGFYYLVKELFDSLTARVSLVIFSFSFYFFAYAHLGYNNSQVVFPFVYGLLFAVLAAKRTNFFYSVLAGVFCGLGWYTFYSSRITILFVALFYFLFFRSDKKIPSIKIHLILYTFIAFFLSILPLLLSSGRTVITGIFNQSLLNPNFLGSYVDDPLIRWVDNFKINLLAFFIGDKVKHYVLTPLLDPLGQLLVIIGIFYLIKHLKNYKYFFILAMYLLSIAMVSFNPIREVVVSRMQISVLLLAIVAGIGGVEIFKYLHRKTSLNFNLLEILLLYLVLLLNLRIFWYDIPRNHEITRESIIVRAGQSSPLPILIHEGEERNYIFRDIIEAYGLRDKIKFTNNTDPQDLSPPYIFINYSGFADTSTQSFSEKCNTIKKEPLTGYLERNYIDAIYCL